MIQKYRPDIDGLRAIAIILVVLYHATITGFKGGFVGVDVFFVISGFLITQHLFSEISEKGKISFLNFYSKRFRRLYPSLVIVILAVLIIWSIFLLGFPEDTKKLYQSVRYSVTGFANIFFKNKTGGYFETSSDQFPLLHFWSLAIEEQFYFCWPLLITLIHYKAKIQEAAKKRMIAALVLIVVVSFTSSYYLLKNNQQTAAFYWMPPRAWELAIGALLVFFIEKINRFYFQLSNIFQKVFLETLTVLGLGLIAVSVFLQSQGFSFPGPMALLPTIGTVFLIISGSQFYRPKLALIYNNKFFVEIGILSYGIYLWHWPFLAMVKVWNIGEETQLYQRVLIILLSILLAKLTLQYIEKPFRESSFAKKISPQKTIFLFVSISAILVGLAFFMTKLEKHLYVDTENEFNKMVAERTRFHDICVDHINKIGSPECDLNFFDSILKEHTNIVVWGDSYGYALYPMIEDFVVREKISSTLYAMSSIAPFNHFSYSHEPILKEIKARIKKDKKTHQSVFMPFYWNYYLNDKHISLSGQAIKKTYSISLSTMKNNLETTLNLLNQMGVSRILLMLPYPEFRYHILKCRMRNRVNCETDRKKFDLYRQQVIVMVQDLIKNYKNVDYFDPTDFLCDEKSCPQVLTINGKEIPVVYDDAHPSSEIGRYLSIKINSKLQWLIGHD